MIESSDSRAWYLVYTKPRAEKVAMSHLCEQGYETYLPLFHNRKRQRTAKTTTTSALFPNYLFIRLNDKTDNWSPIRSTPGVNKLVRFGVYPTKVPDQLIELLRKRENEHGLHSSAPNSLKPGEQVRVLGGPFAGLDAIYQTTNSTQRVLVLMEILGKFTRVEIERENLERA